MNDQKTVCQFDGQKCAANGEIEGKERRNGMVQTKQSNHCWWLWQKIAPNYIVFGVRHFHGNPRIDKEMNKNQPIRNETSK